MVSIQGKSLLGLQGVPKEEIELILRVAKKKKVKSRDLGVFCKQFSAVIKAGVTIISALASHRRTASATSEFRRTVSTWLH